MISANDKNYQRIWRLLSFSIIFVFPQFVHADFWVDWSTGATQPVTDSQGNTGTVSYTHSFSSVTPASMNSPDAHFPFPNPIDYLRVDQNPVDASIEFTFTGVTLNSHSLFTLGNLRPTNRFLISTFDAQGTPVSLVNWTNYGEYRLFPNDTGPNLFDPNTGIMIGNGVGQDNGLNLFFGLTNDTSRIVVNFDNVDGAFDVLDFGVAVSTVPEPSAMGLAVAGMLVATAMSCRMRQGNESKTLKLQGG